MLKKPLVIIMSLCLAHFPQLVAMEPAKTNQEKYLDNFLCKTFMLDQIMHGKKISSAFLKKQFYLNLYQSSFSCVDIKKEGIRDYLNSLGNESYSMSSIHVIMESRLQKDLLSNDFTVVKAGIYHGEEYIDFGQSASFSIGFKRSMEDGGGKFTPKDYAYSCIFTLNVTRANGGNSERVVYVGIPYEEQSNSVKKKTKKLKKNKYSIKKFKKIIR